MRLVETRLPQEGRGWQAVTDLGATFAIEHTNRRASGWDAPLWEYALPCHTLTLTGIGRRYLIQPVLRSDLESLGSDFGDETPQPNRDP